MSKNRVPEVKMTKAAKLRLLKANPLLKYEVEKHKNTDLIKKLNLDTVSNLNQAIIEKSDLGVKLCNGGLSQVKVKDNETNEHTKPKEILIPTAKNHKTTEISKEKQILKKSRPLYRSTSTASHLKPKAGTAKLLPKKQQAILSKFNTSVSLENIPNAVDSSVNERPVSNVFKAPLGMAQPSTIRRSFIPVTPSAPADLKRRLSEWLSKHNKKSTSFKHLKCFGVHKVEVIKEDDKENVDTTRIEEHGSYENLKIDDADIHHKHSEEENSLIIAPSDLERVVKEALNDLHHLMSEGYPIEQCEAWLKIIQNKFSKVIEEPMFWECRASIEQLRGDLGSAIECYKTAVVHGAEVSSVEQSLDQLLHKFKLLEIEDPLSKSSSKAIKNDRQKIVKDFRNVFTSMIIKFAIQEKSLKSKPKNKNSNNEDTSMAKVLVTPVRRSTRISRSMYTSTPGVQLCSSMLEVESEFKDRIDFHTNAALNC